MQSRSLVLAPLLLILSQFVSPLIEHCGIYGSKTPQGDDTCFKCSAGWYASNNPPTVCSRCSSACYECQYQPGNCISCPLKYFMYNGTCTNCPDNCDLCASKVSCLTCSDGYFRRFDNFCARCDSNCLKCDSLTTCDACEIGYDLHIVNGRRICVKPGFMSLFWIVLITLLSCSFMIGLTSWWRSRQEFQLRESEKMMAELADQGGDPNLPTDQVLDPNMSHMVADFNVSQIDHRPDEASVDEYKIARELHATEIAAAVLEHEPTL